MIPESFATAREGDVRSQPIVVRDEVDLNAARPILRRLAEVDWTSLDQLPGQLAAVTVGDRETREEAWWNLWDAVDHEGTIDEAMLPAVPVLIALGEWRDYPDRAHAIVLLREIACAEGIAPRHDRAQFAELREALAAGTRHLAARWRTEEPDVRRALVWLLSAVPEVGVQYHDLIDETLPPQLRPAWDALLVGNRSSEALEAWVFER
jgi:hypothetical protein